MAAHIPTAAKLRWLRTTLAASVERGGSDVAATWDREVLSALIVDLTGALATADQDLHYLRSILGQLREIRNAVDDIPALAGEESRRQHRLARLLHRCTGQGPS